MPSFLTHNFSELPEEFYTLQDWQGFNNPKIVIENHVMKKALGMEDTDHQELLKIFNGTRKIDSLKPLSMVYSGHQFGQYVEQLGDGRGLLFAQINSNEGLLDIHLKGAGKTPYSRFGDGRAVLRSVIREYLCGEAMHALSIPTSRALMIIGSDEMVIREKSESAAMLVRTSKTHIRFGSFEYFHYNNKPEHVKALADFCIDSYPQYFSRTTNAYEDFFRVIVKETANMIAHWQACGFNHGVMNTDNMSILGETFDYGPYGFMEDYNPNHVCNHSDHQGRYAFKNQPYIGLWNCSALGHALSSLISEESQGEILQTYEAIFQDTLAELYRKKLGLDLAKPEDATLIQGLLDIMESEKLDYTNTFRNLTQALAEENSPELQSEISKSWVVSFLERHSKETLSKDKRLKLMNQVNPKFILRNYMAQEAIEAAEVNDSSKLETLMIVITQPYEELIEHEKFANKSPIWAKDLEISCSS
ncbi:MAG: protein adenylyltransferase SelO [Gammaproteobacteria bacterium]|jgi:serine/tyrosine/threonine adenylyltransferase|uniref:Protein nucleotidyltransferase YdiU n=1 Tax=SAR86 cluster bacterium TaxID=2030880 RepID=A0A520MTN9_9GAMM|nr:MAG: YdiU family protein [SAR86 cluster bacterium]|tara:strand:+ start:1080 stop:2504 length:1425 start_codon:yes stop_codon:yes gene_type:complete